MLVDPPPPYTHTHPFSRPPPAPQRDYFGSGRWAGTWLGELQDSKCLTSFFFLLFFMLGRGKKRSAAPVREERGVGKMLHTVDWNV